jgi:ABC-2 type transport system permease protein
VTQGERHELPARLPWFLRVVAAFVRRELVALASYRAAAFTRVAGLATMIVALLFFARFVGSAQSPHLTALGGNYLGFAAVGFLTAGFQQVAVSGLAQRIRMAQMMGTLEAEVASPAPTWMVLGAAPIYELGGTALRAALYLGAAALLVDLKLPRANFASLALALPLVLGAFVGVGLVAAGTTMLVRRTNPVAMLLGSLSFLLSGVIYPVTVLPPALRAVGQLLPLTHALHALRGALLLGASPAALRGPLGALAAFTVVLIPLGAATFGHALRRARSDGSLSHY